MATSIATRPVVKETSELLPVQQQPEVVSALAGVTASRDRLHATEQGEAALLSTFRAGGETALDAEVAIPEARRARAVAAAEAQTARRVYEQVVEDTRARLHARIDTLERPAVLNVYRKARELSDAVHQLSDVEMLRDDVCGPEFGRVKLSQMFNLVKGATPERESALDVWAHGAVEADMLDEDLLSNR